MGQEATQPEVDRYREDLETQEDMAGKVRVRNERTAENADAQGSRALRCSFVNLYLSRSSPQPHGHQVRTALLKIFAFCSPSAKSAEVSYLRESGAESETKPSPSSTQSIYASTVRCQKICLGQISLVTCVRRNNRNGDRSLPWLAETDTEAARGHTREGKGIHAASDGCQQKS